MTRTQVTPEQPESFDAREHRLEALMTQHLDFVWRAMRRFGLSAADADDATQTVFIVASEKLDQIRAGSERPFLYGIALRICANARRVAKRKREVTGHEMDREYESGEAGPDDHLEWRRATTLLDELLQRLPTPLRRAFVLAELEGCSAREISELEGIPVGTASSRLRRARFGFRELVMARGYESPFSEDVP